MSSPDRRPIPGHDGYLVSARGEVFSTRSGECRPIKTRQDRHGYQCFMTGGAAGRRVSILVHQAVLLAFVGPKPTPRHVTRHLDGCRTNNTLTNLAWGTQAENIRDAVRHGTFATGASLPHFVGEAHPHAKLTEADALDIERRARAGENNSELAREYGVSHTIVWGIKTHKYWRHLWVAT